jgi:hypothetical protein
MESSQKFVSTGLAVSMVLLSFVPLALAWPKEDVEAVTLAWGRALREGDPDKVLPHYAQDAVLEHCRPLRARIAQPRVSTS